MWAEVYDFVQQGLGWAARRDGFVRGKFVGKIIEKDGYVVEDCKDSRERKVLAFLVPILYPGKSDKVTVTVGNSIFGALTGQREANWALIIQDVIQKLLLGMGRKPSSITPFLFNLYRTDAW